VSNAGGTGGTPPSAWKQVNGTTVYSGGWAALNPITGGLEWTTPDPAGSFAEGPVSVANGVVFGCDVSTNGTMFGLNAATGAILWSYNSGGSCNGGASIADGVVYWGSGPGTGAGPHKVCAFSVNGL
jgi:polyvinyl alcohol dehydrogenase (cytochrome)